MGEVVAREIGVDLLAERRLALALVERGRGLIERAGGGDGGRGVAVGVHAGTAGGLVLKQNRLEHNSRKRKRTARKPPADAKRTPEERDPNSPGVLLASAGGLPWRFLSFFS